MPSPLWKTKGHSITEYQGGRLTWGNSAEPDVSANVMTWMPNGWDDDARYSGNPWLCQYYLSRGSRLEPKPEGQFEKKVGLWVYEWKGHTWHPLTTSQVNSVPVLVSLLPLYPILCSGA